MTAFVLLMLAGGSSGCLPEPSLVGLSCTQDDRCPSGLTCVDGTCVASAFDASTPDSGFDEPPDEEVDGGFAPDDAGTSDATTDGGVFADGGFFVDAGADGGVAVDGGLPTAARCADPVEYPSSGWEGRYYELTSARTFGPCLAVEDDTRQNLQRAWSGDEPYPGGPMRFGSIWTTRRPFDDGAVSFLLRARDGIRVYVDDQLVYEGWQSDEDDIDVAVTTPYLTAGSYNVRVEHYSESRSPRLSVRWDRGCQLAVSRQDLGSDWIVSYHRLLSDDRISFDECFGWERISSLSLQQDWGASAPAPVAAAQVVDDWALIAVAQRDFDGQTNFSVRSDDGVRVRIGDDDDDVAFERWEDRSVSSDTFSAYSTDSSELIMVEKYDRSGEATLTFSWISACESTPLLAEDQWWARYFGLLGSPLTEYTLDRTTCLGAEAIAGRTLVRTDAPVAVLIRRPFGLWGAEYLATRPFPADNTAVSLAYDDGIRLYSGTTLVFEDWTAPNTVLNGETTLGPGTQLLRVEYLQELDDTLLRVEWE